MVAVFNVARTLDAPSVGGAVDGSGGLFGEDGAGDTCLGDELSVTSGIGVVDGAEKGNCLSG